MNFDQAEVTAGPQAVVEPPLGHVRRKWLLVSTGAWVAGGSIAFALGTIVCTFLLAFGVGGFIGDLANALTEAFSYMLAGVAVALGQWLVFRRVLGQARGWLLASALAWIPAGVLASLAYELFLYSTRLTSGDPDRLGVYAWAGILGSVAAAAIMVGALQWLALRRAFLQPGRWIPASTVGWFVGMGLTLLGGITVSLSEGCFMGMLVFPAAGGLVAAAITGQALVRLVHRAAAYLPETDRGRRLTLILGGVWIVLLVGGLWAIWSLHAPYAAMAQRKLPEGCPPACASTELSGLNLRGAWLREADLSGANLSDAQLAGADLIDANLRGASLSGARLARAEMNGADLSGADLRGADLSGTELREVILLGAIVDDTTQLDDKWRLAWEIVNQGAEGRDLSGVDLSGAELPGARLAGADLSRANLITANLREADLKDANLRDADLNSTELQGADLTGANLEGVEWRFPEIDDTTRLDAKWRLAWEIDTTGLPGADLAGADLSRVNLHGGKLEGANLSGTNLSHTVLFHTYLSNADLTGANLQGADLFDALLMGADLTSADLSNTVLNSADLTGAILEGAVLTGARYSATTIWPAGFSPTADMIKMEKGGCYTDEEGHSQCYGE